MTQVTPIYSFPYPENTDAPDGPSQFHALALAVETALSTNLAGKQPLNANLTALAGLNATAGIVIQTGAAAFTKRSLTAGFAIAITNPTLAAGNATIAVDPTQLWVTGTATPAATNTMALNNARLYAGNLVMADLRVTLGTAITVTAATGKTVNTAICTLPVSMRPVSTVAWSGYQDSGSVACGGVILNTGNVEVRWTAPNTNLVVGTAVFVEAIFNLS